MTARRTTTRVVLAGLCALTVVACAGGDSDQTSTSTTAAVASVSCDRVSGLFEVMSIVGESDDCADWVHIAQGRAVLGATGSASVWSRDTGNETALVVGAVHSLGQGWFGPEGTAVTEAIVDPGGQAGIARLFLRLPDGSAPDTLASPWFGLYNPSMAAERNGNFMQDVLPREDFYVAVTDAQKLDVSGLPSQPAPIAGGPVSLPDPAGVTITQPTYDRADSGELALMLGYSNETGRLTASVGRILDDAAAAEAVTLLAELGDPEGSIAYDGEAEVIIEGVAVAGMSGGPVVDGEGRLIAVLVRANSDHDGVRFARAVRMSHVVSRLEATFDELSSEQQLAVTPYLER